MALPYLSDPTSHSGINSLTTYTQGIIASMLPETSVQGLLPAKPALCEAVGAQRTAPYLGEHAHAQ